MVAMNKQPWLSIASFVFWSVVFGTACTQAPLYFSNQNQYLLHGAAEAGVGYLEDDWLAQTLDPTPLFSGLVAVVYQYLDPRVLYVLFLLIFGIYFQSMVGIFETLAGKTVTPALRLLFCYLLILTHAALPRLASTHTLGIDYPWYLQCGLAGQYILGAVFQPSVFGTLLVLSIYLFLRDRVMAAVVVACVSLYFHATYVLSAAFLTAGFMCVLWLEGRRRQTVKAGLLALLLAAPVVCLQASTFAPTTEEGFAAAQNILVNLRIPHHSIPAKWLDSVALVQVIWMVLGIVLARGSRLFVVLLLTFLCSLILTLLQVWNDNDTLALLFPWRSSAILVPIATTVILTRLLLPASAWSLRHATLLKSASLAGVATLFVSGLLIQYFELGYRSSEEELALLEYVRTTSRPGETYMLPVQLPKAGSGPKGVISTSFTPAPRRDKDSHLIAVDLQRFRLWTGACIVVDFKSVPYKDYEVLEWLQRLQDCKKLYDLEEWTDGHVDLFLRRYQITHIVTPASKPRDLRTLRKVYEDRYYIVYRIY